MKSQGTILILANGQKIPYRNQFDESHYLQIKCFYKFGMVVLTGMLAVEGDCTSNEQVKFYKYLESCKSFKRNANLKNNTYDNYCFLQPLINSLYVGCFSKIQNGYSFPIWVKNAVLK